MKRHIALWTLLLLARSLPAAAAPAVGAVCDTQWSDAARDNRTVPVRIRMPAGTARVPVVIFSHGLGGSTDSGRAWAEAWAEAGLIVVNVQHPGSDRSIIGKGKLREAMAPAQLVARAHDIRFVIDQLGRGGRAQTCDLSRADVTRLGIAGHSYGAYTIQAVAGEHFPRMRDERLADPRVNAAIAFSPSPPIRGGAEAAFADVRIPFFSITGSADATPITPWVKAADREIPFRAMPAGGKFLLVLDGADHMAFNGRGDRGFAPASLTPHVEATVKQASIAFWRWTLLGDEAALGQLDRRALSLSASDRLERR